MAFKLAYLSSMCVFEEALQTEDRDVVVVLTNRTDSCRGYFKNMYLVLFSLENQSEIVLKH